MFSKYATSIVAPKDSITEKTTQLFFKNEVKYWGLSKYIITRKF